MRRKLILAIVAVVALVIGLAIGVSGKTKTVTHTRTVTLTATQTRAVGRRVVPVSCKRAIASARKVAQDAAAGFSVVANWPALASEAAVAGAAQDAAKIYSIAGTLKSGTARLNSLAAAVARDGLAFNAAAAKC